MQKGIQKNAITLQETTKSNAISNTTPRNKIFLAIVPARISIGGKIEETYAFIDTGSMSTICSKSLTNRLRVTGDKVDVMLRTQAGDLRCSERVKLGVGNVEGGDMYQINDVLVTDSDIAATTDDMLPIDLLKRWPHLEGIELPRLPSGKQVEMIIGLNSSLCRTILDVRNGEDDEPTAVKTRLGWIVHGPSGPDTGNITKLN